MDLVVSVAALRGATGRCRGALSSLCDVGHAREHVELVADVDRQVVVLRTSGVRGLFEEEVSARVTEPGEVMVHGPSLHVHLKKADSDGQVRLRLIEAVDPEAEELDGATYEMSIPTQGGSTFYWRGYASDARGAVSGKASFISTKWAVAPLRCDWDEALRFGLSAVAFKQASGLFNPAKATQTKDLPMQVHLELVAADELAVSTMSRSVVVIVRCVADLQHAVAELGKRKVGLPFQVVLPFHVWPLLSELSSVLGGQVEVAVSLGVGNVPRAIRIDGDGWVLVLECADRQRVSTSPVALMKRNPLPEQVQLRVASERDYRGSLTNLLRTAVALAPTGIAVAVEKVDGQEALTIRASCMDGRCDLHWPIEQLVPGRGRGVPDVVLQPAALRTALEALPVETDGSLRLAFLAGDAARRAEEQTYAFRLLATSADAEVSAEMTVMGMSR